MIRIVAGDSFYAHMETRYLELGIIKFENINTYLMGLFVYKSVYYLLRPSDQNYFIKRIDVHEHFTRASGVYQHNTRGLTTESLQSPVEVQ